jgi:hypothetical protein
MIKGWNLKIKNSKDEVYINIRLGGNLFLMLPLKYLGRDWKIQSWRTEMELALNGSDKVLQCLSQNYVHVGVHLDIWTITWISLWWTNVCMREMILICFIILIMFSFSLSINNENYFCRLMSCSRALQNDQNILP